MQQSIGGDATARSSGRGAAVRLWLRSDDRGATTAERRRRTGWSVGVDWLQKEGGDGILERLSENGIFGEVINASFGADLVEV